MRWLYPRIRRLFARQTAEISLLTDPKKLHARLNRPFDVAGLAAGLSNETFVAAPTRWPPESIVRAPRSSATQGGKAQIRDAVLLRLAARIVDTVRRPVDEA
jgi:predicted RNA polymerase sigma factor